MDLFEQAQRIVRLVYQHHFRIPPWVFWLATLAGTTGAFFVAGGVPMLLALLIASLGVWGVLRWRWHKHRSGLLVVARPRGGAPGDPRSTKAQELLLEQLSYRLTATELKMVHAIPVVLGPTDSFAADRIRERLGAWSILTGRIDDRADGGWSSHVSLIEAREDTLTHLDPHTRDRLPARTNWELLASRLSPSRDIQDTPDPLVYGSEIEALIRGIKGRIERYVGEPEEAEALLAEAIECARDSDAPAIDELRCELADTFVDLGRAEEAKDLLRARAAAGNASPELLRRLAMVLTPPVSGQEVPEADCAEARAALEAAATRRSDPKRPMTLYNLASHIGTDDPDASDALLHEAMAESRTYRSAWYVHRHLGANEYGRGLAAEESGESEEAVACAASAARAYSRALRLRPRFQFGLQGRRWRLLPLRVFPRSPIMLANLADAQFRSGASTRWRLTMWRCQRLRKKYVRRGDRLARRGEWVKAYAWWDWTCVGYDDDLDAEVKAAIALWNTGEADEAERRWAAALARSPFALLARYMASERLSPPMGVPGEQDNSEQAVLAALEPFLD